MGAAHRQRRVGAAEGPVDQRHQQLLVRPLVRQQFALQMVQESPHGGDVAVVAGQTVGHRPDLFDQGQHGVVLRSQPDRGGDVLGGHRNGVHRAGQDCQ